MMKVLSSVRLTIFTVHSKGLLSKINVAVTAVEVISRQIHSLRDEDLHAQLKELIEGLMRMWELMIKWHQKQFRTIIGSKAYVHMANVDGRKSSNMKAKERLEKEILNWGASIRDYVSTQKAFVKFLNEWLLSASCRNQKQPLPECLHFQLVALELHRYSVSVMIGTMQLRRFQMVEYMKPFLVLPQACTSYGRSKMKN